MVACSGLVDLAWEKAGGEWKVRQWITRSMSATEVAQPLFEESLASAIPEDTEGRTTWGLGIRADSAVDSAA